MGYFLLLISYAISARSQSNCNRVDAPSVAMGDSTTIQWNTAKPIGICEPQIFWANELEESSMFVCISNNVVKYRVYNGSSTCSGDELVTVTDYAVEAQSFVCNAAVACPYVIAKVYTPASWTDEFTPASCEHTEDHSVDYFVTDVCINIGNYSGKITCQNEAMEMALYHNAGCAGRAEETHTVETGCSADEDNWYFEITCPGITDEPLLTQDLIIIISVAIVGGVALLIIVAAVWCCKKRANETNKETKYDKIQIPNNNSGEGGQQVQMQTRQNNVHNTTDIPPPPGYDHTYSNNIENVQVMNQWLTQNAQIPATDANNYVQIFVNNGFDDLSVLKDITSQDLVEIGITKLGHRKGIMKAIQSYPIQSYPKLSKK